MGIYATEDIWHGQEVMLVNQEQTNDPEEDPWHSWVEERELSQEWKEDGNPQGQREDTEGPHEPPPAGAPIEYYPMESGWKMYSPGNPWRDGTLVQCSTPTPVNNIPGWEALTQEFSAKKIRVAEAPGLRKDPWLTCLNCGGLSAAEHRKKVNMAKVSTIC